MQWARTAVVQVKDRGANPRQWGQNDRAALKETHEAELTWWSDPAAVKQEEEARTKRNTRFST